MFTKFAHPFQLKPINRSTSEQKKESSSLPKPNYHYTQKRDNSENRERSQIEPLKNTSKAPEVESVQGPQVQARNIVRLPDLVKSNSNQELKRAQLRSRILNPQNKVQLPPRVPLKEKGKKDEQKKQEPYQAVQKLKLRTFQLSLPGWDGIQEKTNQDRALVMPLGEDEGAFGVFDGHGQEGELVSQFVKDNMQRISNVQRSFKLFDFSNVFNDTHKKMKSMVEFSSVYSGTTATLLLIRDKTIQCGWVGDSRAILVGKNGVKELSVDHKPNLEAEKARIEQSGGVVDTYHLPNGDPVGPSRVWIKNMSYPGLAMSRSLGDQLAASVGVIQTPDVTQHQMAEDDKFIVIGSDGLWEFVPNEKVAEIVNPYYEKNDPEGACDRLYEEAYNEWKQHSSGVDDITIIVIFLQFE